MAESLELSLSESTGTETPLVKEAALCDVDLQSEIKGENIWESQATELSESFYALEEPQNGQVRSTMKPAVPPPCEDDSVRSSPSVIAVESPCDERNPTRKEADHWENSPQRQVDLQLSLGSKDENHTVLETQADPENLKSSTSPSLLSSPTSRDFDEPCVSVEFSGYVTQEACCKFVCEIFKYILYQRQQLPMPFEQMVFFQKKQQAMILTNELGSRKPQKEDGWDSKKCQRAVDNLEEILHNLEVLFAQSLVPRVLFLLGGNIMLPKELYEVNLQEISLGPNEQSLKPATCLRKIFRTLFMADIFSDPKSVQLMTTTVMVQCHRNCGVSWFRPKVEYKVPTRVKKQIIALSCSASAELSHQTLFQMDHSDWDDYIWFQAPVTVKGFYK
ncbi:MAD2L1-binding protein [Erpetoichthys calabaricus]|uniref:MAD2L1 binding protein n=1 Tax=Erpetoichthys calabaricus TaxID=27687 RepID=A0A8C4SNU3_ERPCA|nr:MAD2L1-binding protein [Erpetoichthys calabaricus]